MPAKQSLEEIISKKPENSGLTPVAFAEPILYPCGDSRRRLLCNCVCGKEHTVDVSYFISGRIISCGCLMIIMAKAGRLTVDEINIRLPKKSKLKAIRFNRELLSPGGQIRKEYLCECECGNTCFVSSNHIISGNTTSCGCMNTPELIAQRVTKVFPVVRKLRETYNNMIGRCYNYKHISYKNYGAKGITVCKEWIDNYKNFLEWALSSGWKDGLRLDKDIKVKGNKVYSPDTCLWVTPKENSRNTSRNVKFLFNGNLCTIKELEELTGLKENKIFPLVFKEKITVEESINKLLAHG